MLEVLPRGRNNPFTPLTAVSIIDVFKVIKNLNYETKTRMFGDSRFCGILPIIDIDEPNNRIDLILTLSDKDADEQVVRDFNNTSIVRALSRNANEGVDARTHIVIKQNSTFPKTASFALEHKTYLTPKFFVDTLNYFLRDIIQTNPSTFLGNHPSERDSSGNPKVVNTRLKFEYSTALSDEIIAAFASGRVQNVIFEEPLPPTDFDPTKNFIQHKKKVFLDVSATMVSASAKTLERQREIVTNHFKRITNIHPELKNIQFTIKFESATGVSQTAYYDSATQEFSLAKKTSIEPSLRQRASAAPTINRALCDRMFAHIG